MKSRHVAFWLAGLCLSLAATAASLASEAFNSVYLSEYLAQNQRGLKDEDGERNPWIEIYNGGATSVNLSGWFLTDSTNNLTKWRFPGVVLLPDKYLVVFASAKDRTKDLAHLHTNFRLSPGGTSVVLVNPGTNIVSSFVPAQLAADVSYGRVRGEPALHGRFARPTPGKANSISGEGFASEVLFDHTSGTFTGSFTLHLTARATGAVVRYTLDGTLPTSGSSAYTTPLEITNSTPVRARAYQPGLLPGPPHTESYVKLNTNVLHFHSDLPVLVMDTFGKDLPARSHGSSVQLLFYNPVNGRTALTNRPALALRGGFRVRGSTSAGMPQSPFALHFLDEFNDEKAAAPVGLPAESDWVLYAPNSYDPVLIHNPFVHQLSRDMGRYSPRTRFVEVYVVRSAGSLKEAHYNGLYVLEEKIKAGRNRVNIDRVGPEDLKPPQVTGGYVLKFDRFGPGESGFGSGGAAIVYVDPHEQVITLPQRAPQRHYLQQYFDDFHRALQGTNWLDPRTGYRAYLDVDAAIDFHVLEVLSGNVDAMVLSTYFHKPRNGKIVCGPHWDFDRALGSTDGRDDNPRQWSTGPFFSGAWWPRLFTDPDFWQQWVDRWQELRTKEFSLTNLYALADRLAGEIAQAQPREYQKWGFQPRGGTYQSELDLMKKWLSNRVDFIDKQLATAPSMKKDGTGSAVGELLTLAVSGTNAVIYYTLDASDPRLPGGGTSSNAVAYASPITVARLKGSASGSNGAIRVTARARDVTKQQSGGPPISTPWSRAVRTEIIVGPK